MTLSTIIMPALITSTAVLQTLGQLPTATAIMITLLRCDQQISEDVKNLSYYSFKIAVSF